MTKALLTKEQIKTAKLYGNVVFHHWLGLTGSSREYALCSVEYQTLELFQPLDDKQFTELLVDGRAKHAKKPR